MTVLKLFGTPLAVGAQKALGCRVVVAVSYFIVAAGAAAMLCVEKIMAPSTRDAIQGD